MSSIVIPGREKAGIQSSDLRRLLKGLIILLLSALVIELLFHFVLSPRLTINTIEINTGADFPYSRAEILSVAGLAGDLSYFSVDTGKIEARIMKHAAVRQVNVQKKIPGKLIINITARTPLITALVAVQNRTVPVVFDKEGVVFQIGKSVSDWNLPVISGLEFNEIQLGMRLPKELEIFLDQLSVLREKNPAMFSLISEIEITKSNNIDYNVMLYPAYYATKVRIGLEISESLLNYILVTLDTISSNPAAKVWEELDFRSDVPVYRIGEG